MSAPPIVKTANENVRIPFDFSRRIAQSGIDGERLQSIEVSAENISLAAGVALPAVSAVTDADTGIAVVAIGPTAQAADGKSFLVRARATTSQGQVLEMARAVRIQTQF